MVDLINHPPHYIGTNGIEVVDVIEGFGLGHHLGSALAYILRADRKGVPIEDLQKAQFYLTREIDNRKLAQAVAYAEWERVMALSEQQIRADNLAARRRARAVKPKRKR